MKPILANTNDTAEITQSVWKTDSPIMVNSPTLQFRLIRDVVERQQLTRRRPPATASQLTPMYQIAGPTEVATRGTRMFH